MQNGDYAGIGNNYWIAVYDSSKRNGYVCLKKLGVCFSGKLYEVKRQYPVVREFSHRMNTVKKELNSCSEKKHH